jgi:electron transfer flavoprotein beta subunit
VEWKRKLGGKVTIITMGPPAAVTSLRECIEMGADRAILISARQFAGADTWATSYVLAEVIKEIHSKDPISLVFFGKQAIDGDTAQVGPGVAVRMDLPVVSYAVKIREVNLEEHYVIIERKTESRNEVIKTSLPTALTCEKDIAEIPYASLQDLVYSLRYEPEVWNAESPITFDPAQLGLKGSPTTVFKTGTPEKHTAGDIFKAAEVGLDNVVRTAFERILKVEGMAPMLGVKK